MAVTTAGLRIAGQRDTNSSPPHARMAKIPIDAEGKIVHGRFEAETRAEEVLFGTPAGEDDVGAGEDFPLRLLVPDTQVAGGFLL